MICTTVREGEECVFMAATGCKYNHVKDECMRNLFVDIIITS